ncbi:molybdopterin dehydrogenase FAD-binding protein [Salinisphaera sp. S4-8]|uniref:FAD binding domain-containing protein n=1 Tax=Salinisphaera sp. S4-8 TaxID=633357 RepID=UPI00333EBF9E
MKAIDYRIERVADIAGAIEALQAEAFAKPIAGGQSLGAMLNLRLAQPECVVDIARVEALKGIRREDQTMVIGALVTHTALEDGRYDDATTGMLAHVAAGIAYRAVRNSGTIGGSLCHADPAADWIAATAALGATFEVQGAQGPRRVAARDFMTSAFETVLAEDEVLIAIHIPALGDRARWSYRKFCRKTGEFALAIVSGVADPATGVERLVFSALDGAPVVVERAGLFDELAASAARAALLDDETLALVGHRRALHAGLLADVLADMRGVA